MYLKMGGLPIKNNNFSNTSHVGFSTELKTLYGNRST